MQFVDADPRAGVFELRRDPQCLEHLGKLISSRVRSASIGPAWDHHAGFGQVELTGASVVEPHRQHHAIGCRVHGVCCDDEEVVEAHQHTHQVSRVGVCEQRLVECETGPSSCAAVPHRSLADLVGGLLGPALKLGPSGLLLRERIEHLGEGVTSLYTYHLVTILGGGSS